jgi:hypothetical protein
MSLSAVASLPATTPTLSRPRLEPLVLVDGYPESRLTVQYATFEAPLDRRRCLLISDWGVARSTRRRWQQARLTVVLPHRLVGDQQQAAVLSAGQLIEAEDNRSAGQQQRRFNLRDDWDITLARALDTIPWVDDGGRLIAQPDGSFELGIRANRSTQRAAVGGAWVHVFQQNGAPWTVATALETLSAVGGLQLALHGLPRASAQAPLQARLDLNAPAGDILQGLLEAYGLIVQRETRWAGGQMLSRHAVRPLTRGRSVPVRWADADPPLSDVIGMDRESPRDAAQSWIAQGEGWLMESTFELVGGWDPAREGQSDSEYGRATSSDFSRFGNVYRQWVLNEDGTFTPPPFNRGEPFDLTGFFEAEAVRPTPLRFRNCVTLDEAANRQPPIVEVSTDGGASWARYSGEAVIATTRAAVYLNDATLPVDFLAAAQDGQAKVRVTASLRSPQPIAERRWRGNPFAGQRPARVFDVSESFHFQRVKEASIHRAAIDVGTLTAAEIDDRQALQRWLVDRMQQADAAALAGRGRATLRLAGAWPMLRPGDQMQEAGGADERLDDRSQRTTEAGALVQSLTVHFPVAHGQGPTTTLQLRF